MLYSGLRTAAVAFFDRKASCLQILSGSKCLAIFSTSHRPINLFKVAAFEFADRKLVSSKDVHKASCSWLQ